MNQTEPPARKSGANMESDDDVSLNHEVEDHGETAWSPEEVEKLERVYDNLAPLPQAVHSGETCLAHVPLSDIPYVGRIPPRVVGIRLGR